MASVATFLTGSASIACFCDDLGQPARRRLAVVIAWRFSSGLSAPHHENRLRPPEWAVDAHKLGARSGDMQDHSAPEDSIDRRALADLQQIAGTDFAHYNQHVRTLRLAKETYALPSNVPLVLLVVENANGGIASEVYFAPELGDDATTDSIGAVLEAVLRVPRIAAFLTAPHA